MVGTYSRDSQRISTPEGHILHLRRWGSGPRICLLLHGFGEGGYVWSDFSDRLPSCYTCLALDFRGHGDSTWVQSGCYTTDMYIRDVTTIVTLLEINSLVIVGHSMGAEVAIRASIQLAFQILGLVIVDYGPEVNEESSMQIRSDFKDSLKPFQTVRDYAAVLEEKRFLASPAILSEIASNTLKVGSDGLFRMRCDPALADMEDVRSDIELWQILQTISCKAMLVRGKGSAIVSRRTAFRMREILGPASLCEVDLAGHAVMIDNPDGFAAAVLPFLQRLAWVDK